ncbi:MAG: site-specific DNA-methyltransferase [Armatimonadota bacterium]
MATKDGKDITQYEHADKQRVNNPPVGLVTLNSDPLAGKKTYQYDPHIDPSLQWAGKTEHTSFDVPTVSLHVHERIDPRTIIEAVRKRMEKPQDIQLGLFESPVENPPLREAIDFYKHSHAWSNRLIAGDSLLVMNSLLEKEGMAGKVQMVYIDPPYGIKYGSNFQPFVNKRDVKDGKDEDLTQEPEMIKAFRDTWELGIHSYLTYLRDRLLLAREMLTESGSCFVQISDENLHHVRELMDELFGSANCVSIITFAKTSSATAELLAGVSDYLIWYAKDKKQLKYRQLFIDKEVEGIGGGAYTRAELPDGRHVKLSQAQRDIPDLRGVRIYRLGDLTSQRPPGDFPVEYEGKTYTPRKGYWKTGIDGFAKLKIARRIESTGPSIYYVRYIDDFPAFPISNLWSDTVVAGFVSEKKYVVETSTKVVQRCILMTTDPGDLVLDPTCGSGTTASVAEQWGRRWITCDTSRVATTLAKQRLMTATFDYYEMAHPEEGVGSGFVYKTVPHIMLKSIANNPEIREGMPKAQIDAIIAKYADQEALYDQPKVDNKKVRVTGPFTMEAVPAPVVKPLDDVEETQPADESVARSGETARQAEWRDEILKTGVIAHGGLRIDFSRVESLAGTRWLHADAETKGDKPERAVIVFGPDTAPLEQRQVALALEETAMLIPKPAMVIFAAFQFDPEAAKDIDETPKALIGMTLLKAQMNTDLLTDDLKKKRASNQSFWLIGQPDVELRQLAGGKCQVEVHGFDYYNPVTGTIESGDTRKIAMWMLDTDYDGRSLYPRQVFFPMAGEKDGWSKLARNLKADIDEDRIEAYRGTVSLPFNPGMYKRIAVKIVDDRGIESLKIVGLTR